MLDEVTSGLRLQGAPAEHTRERSTEALARVGLAAETERHPFDLDAGARRLTAVAAAIAHAPGVRMDEKPCAALAVRTTRNSRR